MLVVNLYLPFKHLFLWVVVEVPQVNTASKTWNLPEPRAWKVALPNHTLLKTELCCYKLGSNPQPLRGTGSVAINLCFLLRNFQVSQNP